MKLFKLFKKKQEKYELTDTDRMHGLRVRELNRRIKETTKQMELLQKERELNDLLEDLREMNEEEAEETATIPENADSLMMSLLTKLVSAKVLQPNNQPNETITPTTTTPTGLNLSYEQINAIYENLPKGIKKKIATATDSEIKDLLIKNYPNLNNVEETISFLRNRKI